MKEFQLLSLASAIALLCLCSNSQAQQSEWQGELSLLTEKALNEFLKDPDESIKLSHEALKLSIAYDDKFYEGYSFYLLSKGYWAKANYRLSTEYGFKALKFFENSEHKALWASSLLSIARTLVELGNFEKAEELIRAS